MRAILAVAFLLCAVPASAKTFPDVMNDSGSNYSQKEVVRYVAPKRAHHKTVYARRTNRSVRVARIRIPVVAGVAAKARFIAGRLVCAVNVNAELAARGIRGTGSRLAKSFLRWGRPTDPAPGAIAVFNRGRDPRKGHVAIVYSVQNGRILYLNPSPRGWRVIVINRRPIAFRSA